MIEAKGQMDHVANGNRVHPHLICNNGGLFEQPTDAQDRAFGQVDDGRSKLLAVNACVGQRKGAGSHFIRLQLLTACTLGQVRNGAGHAQEAALFRLLDDRNNQTPIQ